MRRHIDGFLAGGCIQHQQGFLRFDQVAQADQLLHQRLINVQPSGRVEDERVAVVGAGELQRLAGDALHVRLALPREHGQAGLLAEPFESTRTSGRRSECASRTRSPISSQTIW